MQIEQQQTQKSKERNALPLPSLPTRNDSLRNNNAIVELTTNLLKLQISQNNKTCSFVILSDTVEYYTVGIINLNFLRAPGKETFFQIHIKESQSA